jgi:hypothetical protein
MIKRILILIITVLAVGPVRAQDITIQEQEPNSFVWQDYDGYSIRVSHDLWLQVVNYGNLVAEKVAHGVTQSEYKSLMAEMETKAVHASQNPRLERWLYETALNAFNTRYEDLRLKANTAKIAEPPAAMIKHLAAHNIVFLERAATHDNQMNWVFAIKDPHSAREINIPVPVGSSEQYIISEFYKSTSGSGPLSGSWARQFLR